jgi:CrcB protein
MLLDEPEKLGRFLSELRGTVPEAPISVARESVEHVCPPDFLDGGVLRPGPFRVEMGNLGLVFAGGALGGGARLLVEWGAARVSPFHDVFPWFALGGWINHKLGPGFPWGALAVNVAGCFVLGLLEGAAPNDDLLLLVLGKGLIAGFTTFSTLMFETLTLARAGWQDRAAFNVIGSLILGVLALLFGLYLGTVAG